MDETQGVLIEHKPYSVPTLGPFLLIFHCKAILPMVWLAACCIAAVFSFHHVCFSTGWVSRGVWHPLVSWSPPPAQEDKPHISCQSTGAESSELSVILSAWIRLPLCTFPCKQQFLTANISQKPEPAPSLPPFSPLSLFCL